MRDDQRNLGFVDTAEITQQLDAVLDTLKPVELKTQFGQVNRNL